MQLKIFFSVFLDFKKATEAIIWFKSYLENRKQYVKVINAASECLDDNIGIPQGSIFGPLLFSM